MKLALAMCVVLVGSSLASAQHVEPSILASGGLAGSSSIDSRDDHVFTNFGFYVKVEYAHPFASFLSLRPFGGLWMTWPDHERQEENQPECKRAVVECESSAQLVIAGAKLRAAAPIPWFAPFVDIGAALGVGASRTHSLYNDRYVTGPTFILPMTLGVAIGADHGFELALSLHTHSAARQLLMGMMLGLHFPLETR